MTKRFTLSKALLITPTLVFYPILIGKLSNPLPPMWIVVPTTFIGAVLFGVLLSILITEQKNYKDYR